MGTEVNKVIEYFAHFDPELPRRISGATVEDLARDTLDFEQWG